MNRRFFRGNKRVRRVVSVVLVTFCAAFVLALIAAAKSPDWWNSASVSGKSALDEAEALENSILREASKIRPAAAVVLEHGLTYASDEWYVEITQDNANAWIATRLPRWYENQNRSFETSAQLAMVRVSFFRSGVHIGMPIDGSPVDVVASLRMDVDGGSDAKNLNVSVQPSIGCLPTPALLLESIMDESNVQLLSGENIARSVRDALTIELQDGRRVRVCRVRFEEGMVRIYCRTEK